MNKNKKKASMAGKLAGVGLIFFGLAAAVVIGQVIFRKDEECEKVVCEPTGGLSSMTVKQLRKRLRECIDVSVEDYEQAAVIRDIIAKKKSHIL